MKRDPRPRSRPPATGGAATTDAARWAQVCAVLDAVFDAPAGQHQQVLREECAGDQELAREVASLLAEEAKREAWLDTSALEWAVDLMDETEPPRPAVSPGDRVGPFRLVSELARGGMGTVWEAERADGQFEQRVALKLLKRGLDSDAILARFLQERRILARLDHPNIARLVDGGVTDNGRPYFAMELIDGEPITAWCDARRLSVRQRLELVRDVAGAVQYAHQQLVVHRDLKPSNVLVTATGEVKLLDFGIAKLLDPDRGRADSATLTRIGWRMMTPEYAAPEQLQGEAATAATDVYALGVLLYELLTGQRPKAVDRPERSAAEVARRPAPRMTTQVGEEVARARGSSVERLRRTLRGDVETIVQHALEPEPERRYGSAQALRDDLDRYLAGEPIRARPASPWYRTRKFVSRNRLAVAATALVVLSLAGGLLAAAWQARVARNQANEAERQARRAEEVKDFLTSIFEASDPAEWRGQETTAPDLLARGARRADEELAGDPVLHAEMLDTIGGLYVSLGDLERAGPLIEQALEQRRELFGADDEAYADSLHLQARWLFARGALREARTAGSRAVEIFEARLGRHADTASALGTLADIESALGNQQRAVRLRRRAMTIHRAFHGRVHRMVLEDLLSLGDLLVNLGRFSDAEAAIDESLDIARRLYGAESTWVARVLNSRGRLLRERGDTQQALSIYEQAVEIARGFGPAHPDLTTYLVNYGVPLYIEGHLEEARRVLEEALERARETLPAEHFHLALVLNALALRHRQAGDPVAAEPLMRETTAIVERSLGLEHDWTFTAWSNLGRVLLEQGRLAEAEPLLSRALEGRRGRHGVDSPRTAGVLQAMAELRFEQGARREAIAMAEEAVAMSRRGFGPRDRRTAVALVVLAELRLRQGRSDTALTLAREAVPMLESFHGELAPSLLRAKTVVGGALARLGRGEKARTVLEDVREARRRVFGASSWQVAEVEGFLATALSHSGRSAEAEALRADARARLAATLGADHWRTRLAAESL